MDRILINTPAMITTTFYVDGLAADPDSQQVTLTVTRSDGTILLDTVAANRLTTGVYGYQLTTTQTGLLDHLTATWVSLNLGTITTNIEVVGGFLFTINELRAYANAALSDTTKYPTQALQQIRTEVEDALETELGYALVPRYASTTILAAQCPLQLKPYLRAVRSVNDDTTALTVSDLTLNNEGFISGYRFRGPTTVAYEHGLDSPPAHARLPALQLAKLWASTGPIDDRTTTISNAETGMTSVFAVPGVSGSIFGVPSVDQFVRSNRLVAVA